LEFLNLGPYAELKDYCKLAEWEADETIFPKVTGLAVQVPWPSDNKGYVEGLQLHILPKFPNLEILALQKFFGTRWTTGKTRADAVKHIGELGYFQILPKLKTVFVTNLGLCRDWDEVKWIPVDKENFERMADEMRELSGDEEPSDSNSSVDEQDLSSSDLD